LVESKADVAARTRCFSPPPSHHLSLTICLAAKVTLHSNTPSTATKPRLLHTCAASARHNDAHPPDAPLVHAVATALNTLLCTSVLTMDTLRPAVFWSSGKLTSLRGTSASALPPLTIFHSLFAFQRCLDCT
jgi:hypothetical protein